MRVWRGAATAAAVGIVAALSAGIAGAATPRVPVGARPRLPAAARVTGTLRADRHVGLSLSLTSRDPLGMARMATAVATPGSPHFRHFLGVAGFAARYGAPPARIAAVTRALRARGLHVSAVDANHLTLNVAGTAADVQRAFATRLAAVRMADGRRAYAARRVPTLPASLAPDVDAVVGLSTLYRPEADQVAAPPGAGADVLTPHATGHVVTGGPQPCAAATATAENPKTAGYTADQIASAYNFSGLYAQGDEGAGQTIAVYELEKLNPADVDAYQACYGTSARVSYRDVGRPRDAGDDEEAALDVDQIIGLAPAAHLIVYQAADSALDGLREYSQIVSEDRARTVSVSWGSCEPKITLDGSDRSIVKMEDKLFQEAALQGQSILSASGDTGSAACARDLDTDRLAVQDPASQPFATGVGGTTLYTDVNGQTELWNPAVPTYPAMQSVWNDGEVTTGTTKEPSATTGGLSTLWAMPAYQRRARSSLHVIGSHSDGRPCQATRCREVPDVSADGDPASGYVVYATTGRGKSTWVTAGGTSAAAPLWAALTAETNALPSCRGAALGFENPSLYRLAAGQPGDLTDIAAASPLTRAADNDATGTNGGLYPVGPGYDMATGLGTPDAAALAAGLCALRAPVLDVTVRAPGDRRAVLHARAHLRVRGTDSGKLALRYSATGLPRGLEISRSGVISGAPRQIGHFSVTVTAVDQATNRATVRFSLTVVAPPATLSHVALTGVARRSPRLAFEVTRGRLAAPLRSITVRLPDGLTFGRGASGVRVSAHHRRVHAHVHHDQDTATIVLVRPDSQVLVTIAHPSLLAGGALAQRARRHRSARVPVRIAVTDGRHDTARRTYSLTLSH